MPEGNTIHRLARDHARDFSGRIVRVSSPQGRFAAEARKLDRGRFLGADAWGKHLFHFWQGGLVVHMHLGMAGEFRRFAGKRPPPRPTVRMRLLIPHLAVDLTGPPTCELVGEAERLAVVARLGPDPLRRDGDPEIAWEGIAKRPDRPIGDALLDQRVISGVGNIYRNEVLFLHGVHPLRPAKRVSKEEWLAMWETLRRLMARGVREGTITVDARETPHPASGRGAENDEFYVYGQTVCRRCGGSIRELPLSGRRMFACPACQSRRRVRPGGLQGSIRPSIRPSNAASAERRRHQR